jgi:formamidopyrimidine-DNA glycosylase
MPELPEVEALAGFLRERAAGRVITSIEVGAISALKTFRPPPEALIGRRIEDTTRRGKWLALETSAPDVDTPHLFLATHLARAGWLRWYTTVPPRPVRPGRSPIALRLRLDDDSGFDLTEAGTRKRLAVYVVEALTQVPPIAALGIEPLSTEFTPKGFAALLASRNQQVKGLLRDQNTLAGIGNAYSDEILLVARMSPFALTRSLDAPRAALLYDAVVGVLRDAVETAHGRPATELKDSKRRAMRVHGRAGLPCPGWNGAPCGDTVHEVSFADSSLQYCPTCQTNGVPLADRRMSRLLR